MNCYLLSILVKYILNVFIFTRQQISNFQNLTKIKVKTENIKIKSNSKY